MKGPGPKRASQPQARASTAHQAGRFFDLRQTEDLAVKLAGLLVRSSWDGYLDVVNASDHFLAPL